MSDRAYIPDPVQLLCDEKGIYGIGLCDKYLAADLPPKWPRRENKLVLRPDRIEEACGVGRPVLQWLPQRGWLFGGSQEANLRDTMCAVMRHCAGITDEDRPLGDKRQAFYGLEVKATRVFNWLYGQALIAADPEALRVARRFPPSMRWEIYSAAARSPRMRQLAKTFPLLAYRITEQGVRDQDQCTIQQAARALVESGARLREVAAATNIPMELRRIQPGAVHLALQFARGVLRIRPKLVAHMPESLPQMRRWLHAVNGAYQAGGEDYATWVARHAADIDRQEIENLFDWVTACKRQADLRADREIVNWIEQGHMPAHMAQRMRRYLPTGAFDHEMIERPFVPTMSLVTVRELSAEWHEAMAKKEDAKAVPFPEPWFPVASLVNGYEIVPITNSADLYREGKAMHHCVGSYDHMVIAGHTYIYGIREGDKRIATVEITRAEDNKPKLGQIRGPCNAPAPKEVVTATKRWLRSQKNELPALPPPDEWRRHAA
jgi:PcfJ-like protein